MQQDSLAVCATALTSNTAQPHLRTYLLAWALLSYPNDQEKYHVVALCFDQAGDPALPHTWTWLVCVCVSVQALQPSPLPGAARSGDA